MQSLELAGDPKTAAKQLIDLKDSDALNSSEH